MLKNLVIKKSSVFYILAPRSKFTGGPTLLHQLGYNLQEKYNYKVMIFYYGKRNGDPVHHNYKKYNLKVADFIDDKPENILISGEIIQHLNICLNLLNIQKILWWLSVDFFYISQKKFKIKKNYALWLLNKINNNILKIFSKKLYLKIDKIFHLKNASNVLKKYNFKYHLCQSYYAYEHLKTFKFDNVYMLSDYLEDEFLTKKFKHERRNVILYNPKKGTQTTNLIIKQFPNYNFKKIENLSREEVINLISSSKIYIDFGEHPGKDRIPREAAYLGACIITGMKGSAANHLDIEIPSKYKFNDKKINFIKLGNLIDSIFINFPDHQNDFSSYRNKVLAEKKLFESDLDKLFK